MAAIFWVTFDCGSMVQVYSADAKTMKRVDLREASRKAAAKAKARLARQKLGHKSKVVNVRCVG